MKKYFFVYALLLMAVGMSFMVVSCSSDNDTCIEGEIIDDDTCIEGEIVQLGEEDLIINTAPISSGTYQCLGNTLIGIPNSDVPRLLRFLGNRIAFKVVSFEYIGDRIHAFPPGYFALYECRIELCN